MRDAARDAADFVQRFDRAEMDANRWFGLVKWIEIVGEAAMKVTVDFRQRHPEIPWAQITGMRHWLVHGYDQLNFEVIWRTAVEDLPPLVAALERILAVWPEESDSDLA